MCNKFKKSTVIIKTKLGEEHTFPVSELSFILIKEGICFVRFKNDVKYLNDVILAYYNIKNINLVPLTDLEYITYNIAQELI